MSFNLSNYQCSGVGLLLPIVNEYTWHIGARGIVYLLGLLWSFMGVSIITDIFMSAIETITSRTKRIEVYDPSSETGKREMEIVVWNGTVVNLTLMALGSSTPEILLTIIEIFGNNFHSGSLGPSTIVGSAAFNFMCITGVCLLSIPDGEVRRIKHLKVFAVTAFFSIFAYVWLIIILVAVSPDYVEVWEGFLTLLFYPLLVILAYLFDKDYCSRKPRQEDGVVGSSLDLESLAKGDGEVPTGVTISANQKLVLEFVRKLRREKGYTEKDISSIASYIINRETPHSRGWYRRNAIRNLTGGCKIEPKLNERTRETLEAMLFADAVGLPTSDVDLYKATKAGEKTVIEFAALEAAVLEKDKHVKLTVMRHGNLKTKTIFRVETKDGTAESVSDYIPINETMVFAPNEKSKEVNIEIVDDNIWEPDEVFFVRLTVDPDEKDVIIKRGICQVTILNDDEPGVVQFPKPSFLFKESCGVAQVPIHRVNGADGEVKVKWKTKDISAVAGRDYENIDGDIVFKHGETEKTIDITIHDDQEFEKDENFELEILEANGGARIGHLKRTIVTITNDDDLNGLVSRIIDLTNANLDAMRKGRDTWAQQFTEAMNVNGGDLEKATAFDYVMHFLTFGWKIIFAFVPPPSIWGGWLCFLVSLLMIGILTTLIKDLAEIFGCLIGLEDAVTAITFVALGTSLPDLFASKQAAAMEKHADNSIGNITGSNSVIVFLGLGLAWFIAAIYWTAQGKTFEVPAKDLGFSVVVYTICVILSTFILMLRRYLKVFGQAELGGPKVPKILCGLFLIVLWVLYVVISSLQVYGHIRGF